MSFYQFTLTSSTTTEVLTENPAGWKDIGKTYIRSDFYHGIFRSLTLTMRFSNVDGGGTELIEDEYNLNAIKAEVNIVIARKNLRTDDYDTIFEGILDFDPDRVTFERDFIEIGAIDGSKEKKFASRDTINYNVKSLISTDNESITDFSNSPKEIDLPPINIYLEGQTYGAQATNPTGIVSNDSDTVLYSRTINKNELGDRLISIIGEKIYENTSDEGINITLDLQSLYNITWDITGLSYPNSSTLNIQI
ncbi:MAG: hypothetical protein GY870_11890, partial [archaeon]|nr:hypothetical protein [archaeon]